MLAVEKAHRQEAGMASTIDSTGRKKDAAAFFAFRGSPEMTEGAAAGPRRHRPREIDRDVVCDANVLIDLEAGRLLDAFFRLPLRFHVPADLYRSDLEQRHPQLRHRLSLDVPDADAMRDVARLSWRHKKIDTSDSFALELARRNAWLLLTGDRALRAAAELEKVSVHGTLWVVERLLESGAVSPEQAEAAFERMKASGRLPWDRARALCRRAAAARRGV